MLKTMKFIGWVTTAAVVVLLAYLGFIYASPTSGGVLAHFLRTSDGTLTAIIVSSEVLVAWLIRGILSEVSANAHPNNAKKEVSPAYLQSTTKEPPKAKTVTNTSNKTQDDTRQQEMTRLRDAFRERLNQSGQTSNGR